VILGPKKISPFLALRLGPLSEDTLSVWVPILADLPTPFAHNRLYPMNPNVLSALATPSQSAQSLAALLPVTSAHTEANVAPTSRVPVY